MRVLLGLLLLLALTTSSSAVYCLCKDGIGDNELQTSIDYACGTLADCNPINDKGPCYQPNNIKSHCDWAVNSYFQNAAQVPGSCNFSGTATTTPNPPSNLVTGCIYPSSPNNNSTISPPSTGTPPNSGTPFSPPGTPPTNGTTPNSGTPFSPPGTPPTNGTTPNSGTPFSPPGTPPTNGTTPNSGTPFPFLGSPPLFGPTGSVNPGSGASTLVISSVFTLCLSLLAVLM